MEECHDNLLPDCSLIIHEDSNDIHSVKETVCPLCQSVLRLYQIHFDEKFMMCGNVECSFPFGSTDCHIYKIDCNEEFSRSEGRSTFGTSLTSGSTLSLTDWTEMEKSMQFDSIRSPAGTSGGPLELEKLAKIKEIEKSEVQLRKNVKRINELNKSLTDPLDEYDTIVNEKWIKRIAAMEERSGVQLLRQDEIMRMRKKEPKCIAQLKINIGSSEDIISVKIGDSDDSTKK